MNEKSVLWHLRTYPLIIILIVGLFGNGFILFIFRRPGFRASTITKYVQLLAITDTILLFAGLIPSIYKGFNDTGLEDRSTVGCILQRFIMFFSGDMSVWVLTVMTIDRLVAVVFPTQNTFWKSQKNTIFVLIMIVSLSLLKNFPVFFTIHRNSTTKKCEPLTNYAFYENRIRPILSLILYYFIPMTTMTVCTVMIVKKMKSVVTKLRTMSNVSNRPSVSQGDSNGHYSK